MERGDKLQILRGTREMDLPVFALFTVMFRTANLKVRHSADHFRSCSHLYSLLVPNPDTVLACPRNEVPRSWLRNGVWLTSVEYKI